MRGADIMQESIKCSSLELISELNVIEFRPRVPA